MEIEQALPNLHEQLADYPVHRRFCLRDVCWEEWQRLTAGQKSHVARQFKHNVQNGRYPNVVGIGTYYFRASEEYIKVA